MPSGPDGAKTVLQRGGKGQPKPNTTLISLLPAFAVCAANASDYVLQDKSEAAHRMGVHLVVCSTHGIHIENSLAKNSIAAGGVGPGVVA